MEEASNNNADIFVYLGESSVVPQDVVRVRVHPSVTVIRPSAFEERYKLEEVELCDGLLEIGCRAFSECKSLKRISIPSTVNKISFEAFYFCEKLEEVQHDHPNNCTKYWVFSILSCTFTYTHPARGY